VRSRGGAPGPAPGAAGDLPALPRGAPFALAALTLMRSRLNRSPSAPASYEAVERVALSPFLR
jgi:hypothetical protein